jgi:predicted dehydrogenase
MINIAVIGAGVRGSSLSRHIAKYADQARIVAVAEPQDSARASFAREFRIAKGRAFKDWKSLLKSGVSCRAAVVATLDNAHTTPAAACLRKGWHLLIEKPMADTAENCEKIIRAWKKAGTVAAVCHTLRFSQGFTEVKKLMDEGAVGRVMTVNQMEEIGNIRFAHNYVRGRWANDKHNTFLLLHKSCHDLDYIAWLAGSRCTRVSSFGGLAYFKKSEAPEKCAARCTENCAIEPECPYSALRLYTRGDLTAWPACDVSNDHSREAHLAAVRTGPYGQCVWHADNNVVDHQVAAMEFESGATATFTLSGFTGKKRRLLQVQGTRGEIRFDDSTGEIIVQDFYRHSADRMACPPGGEYHPEDGAIVRNWLNAVRSGDPATAAVDPLEAFEKLKIAFAAERSRLEKRTVKV